MNCNRDDRSSQSSESDSEQEEESLCIGEEIVLGHTEWDLVQNHARPSLPQAALPLLEVVGDLDGVRISERASTGTCVLWLRDGARANIHRVESPPARGVHDADGRSGLDMRWVWQCLRSLKDPDASVLWTLLRARYPSLCDSASEANDPGTPSLSTSVAEGGLGSWTCSCGHLNVGFKAQCEKCRSHPPSGWWKMDSTGPKLPSLDSAGGAGAGSADGGAAEVLLTAMDPSPPAAFPAPAFKADHDAGSSASSSPSGQTLTFKVTRSGQKVGWVLRNDDLVIISVDTDSPANRANILPGMRLLAIGAVQTKTIGDVRDALASCGPAFDVTVSLEPVTKLKAASSLSSEDGLVVVVLYKGAGDKMGTTWGSKEQLILTEVEPMSAADRSGLSNLLGWRLTHINYNPVHSSDDIIREAAGQTTLTLHWARPTPGPPMYQHTALQPAGFMPAPLHVPQFPVVLPGPLPQVNVGMLPQVAKHQPVFAPSVLWVVAPKDRVALCGGLYRLDKDIVNGQPHWSHVSRGMFLYCSAKGVWCISDVVGGAARISSALPATVGMPDTMHVWEMSGVDDPSIKVLSQVHVPGTLKVDVGFDVRTEGLRGSYILLRQGDLLPSEALQQSDSSLPFKLLHGMPVWKGSSPESDGSYIYSCKKGFWHLTEDPNDIPRSAAAGAGVGGGALCSKAPHGGTMPFEIAAWQTSDKNDRPDVKVSSATDQSGGAQGTPPDPPKTNVNASVHENVVWRYDDIGSFRLASHLRKVIKGCDDLLWVCGDSSNAQHGWLGIDLSNEKHRGQLVRTLTELVDQECITVRQPIVAGVQVRTTEAIPTPEGETLKAGLTGQVVSVLMSRHPVGNTPPRMAKVNFYGGTKTVTVSYGQVEPTQGPFDLGAKVRVLAVDAVAVVDSEAPASLAGSGVRGKYRIKYATGKTYHVRNFALMTADRPWGDGDETLVDKTFKEGTKVTLKENIVFSTLDTLSKGTTGVITHNGAYEVLAGGCLFLATQEQLIAAEPFKKGDLVSPAVPGEGKSWVAGRVESVSGSDVTILTPSRERVTCSKKTVRVEHFLTGQEVVVRNLGDMVWREGVVERVLPSGVPIILAAGDPSPSNYWFVRHRWEDASRTPKLPSLMVQESFPIDDEDPLVSMDSYLTMDAAMLDEAEIMRRRWIESQRLKGAIHHRLQAMEGASRITRLEASCNHVVMRKGKHEKMGTTFHLEDTLVLTKVNQGTAAEKCGVGRFVGRLLVSIDNHPVSNCEHIRRVAAGKDIMNLQFKETPMCPSGHPMHIILNEDHRGHCPGCLKSYNVTYFACKHCYYDVCGKCGQADGEEEEPLLLQHQPIVPNPTTSLPSAVPPVPPPQQPQQQEQQQAFFTQTTWGASALLDQPAPVENMSGMEWGETALEEKKEDDDVLDDGNVMMLLQEYIGLEEEADTPAAGDSDDISASISSILSRLPHDGAGHTWEGPDRKVY